MSSDSHFFHGNPLAYAIQGFVTIGPGETVTGPFFCIGPLDDAVIIQDAVNTFGGNLNNKTIRVSVFGYFDSVSVSSASTGTIIAYRTN